MSVCAAPTCSHQSFDGSSYYVDVDVSVSAMIHIVCLIRTSRVITLSTSKDDSVTVKKTIEGIRL